MEKSHNLSVSDWVESLHKDRIIDKLFNCTNDAIFIVENNTIVDCNNQCIEIFGMESREDIVGKTPFDLSPEFQPQGISSEDLGTSYLKRAIKGEELLFSWLHFGRNDTEIYSHVRLSAFSAGKSRLVMASLKDVTDTTTLESILQESEQRFLEIVELQSQCIIRTNTDGFLNFANSCFLKSYSGDRATVMGTHISEYIFPGHRDQLDKLLSRENKGTRNGEFRTVDVNGETRWINWTDMPVTDLKGNTTGYQIEWIDITASKSFKKTLRHSERKFVSIFKKSPFPIAIVDLGEGRFVDLNPAFCSISGYSREDLIGRTSYEANLWLDANQGKELEDLILSSDSSFTIEIEMRTRLGEIRYLICMGNVIFTDSQKHALLEFNDITSRKLKEIEIQRHESLLRSMSAELTLVEEKERRQIATYLHDYLGQSLAMAKIKTGQLMTTDISSNTMADLMEIEKRISEAIKYTQSVIYDLSPPILYELGLEEALIWKMGKLQDDYQIKTKTQFNGSIPFLEQNISVLVFRSVTELINNIVKHANAREVILETESDNTHLLISLSDNGDGFDTRKVFEGAADNKSFGLLSIRERLMNFGGEMEISSEPGKGTMIKLRIRTI